MCRHHCRPMAWAVTHNSTRCGSCSACQDAATDVQLFVLLVHLSAISGTPSLEMHSLPGQVVEDQVCWAVAVMAVALGLHAVECCSSRGHCSLVMTGEGAGRHPRGAIGAEKTNEQSTCRKLSQAGWALHPAGALVAPGWGHQPGIWWSWTGIRYQVLNSGMRTAG